MPTNILKLHNLSFPIFTLSRKPYGLVYKEDKIYCRRHPDSHLELLDDKSIPGDYFNRLLTLETRIHFDHTCRNIQDLLYTKAKWGMDCNAQPCDFSQMYYVPAEKRLVTKITDNLVWLKNISYPFVLATKEKVSLTEELYATIVYVNNEWYILDFATNKYLGRKHKLV